MTNDAWATLYVFVLASFIGLGVIRRVSRLLHTPLMSLTNAISAITVVGSIIVTGGDYPHEEFASVYGEQGFGGLHYTEDDTLDPVKEGALNPNVGFDCLNTWSQSGTMRMLRRGDWKLVFDMQGRGQLYNIAKDPAELQDYYGKPEAAAIQRELTAELLAWTLRAQDPLPLPRRRYVMKADPRNYWSPYR